MFAPQSAARPAPGLASNRLQNGKLGNSANSASSWLPSATSRNTFAQTLQVGSAQQQQSSQAPLDLSDFPSLGAPSAQQNPSAAQSMWSNNQTIRAPLQGTQGNVLRASGPSLNQQQLQDDSTHFGPGSDSYRLGAAGHSLAGLAQTPNPSQQGVAEDFPPLSGLGGDPDRRGSLLSAFSNQGNLGLQNSRLGYDRSDVGLRTTVDRNPTPRGRTLTNPNPFPAPETSLAMSLGGFGTAAIGSAYGNNSGPIGFRGRNGFPDNVGLMNLGADISFSQNDGLTMDANPPARPPQPSQTQRKRISEMTPRERLGLPGLLAKLDHEHPDFSPLMPGLDIAELGLDLSRPLSTPLYSTFGSPFGPIGAQESRPPVPEFSLPPAYSVTNVPPLHTKIPSMSDDCLLFVFYSQPRDLAQELAAQELYTREWRWHFKSRTWIHRDPTYGVPVRGSNEERGMYIVFNAKSWRRERRELIISYEDLENRHGPPQFNQ